MYVTKSQPSRHAGTPQLTQLIVLPAYAGEEVTPSHPAKEVTKVALRLKYQIEQVIPCELDEDSITSPNSKIITHNVVETAVQAGGDDLRDCVPFCLLVCLRWFKRQATLELWDADLHELRATACEVIAKRMYVVPMKRLTKYILLMLI
jgi:hypothetical protein